MTSNNDNRRVALIKSLATNNRFYVLVEPERNIRNADTVEHIPDDLLLGIAYPCLEDGLNDFAVIRTTFETLDLFPDDDPYRDEMKEIINDARGNLLRRLVELHDKIDANRAHFLGTDYSEFKSYALDMMNRGYSRRNLDSMMKLNVFSSVSDAEGNGEEVYFFTYDYADSATVAELDSREFIVSLFREVIESVKDDANYAGKYPFDKNVFQKFIAVMFINYATTDPLFYGINKKDYGVSADKDMESTPLYQAIRKELLEIEERLANEANPFANAPVLATPDTTSGLPDFSLAAPLPIGSVPEPGSEPALAGSRGHLPFDPTKDMLPGHLVAEEVLMNPIISLCSAADLLIRKSDPDTQRFAKMILGEASRLITELKRLGIISDVANDPSERNL